MEEFNRTILIGLVGHAIVYALFFVLCIAIVVFSVKLVQMGEKKKWLYVIIGSAAAILFLVLGIKSVKAYYLDWKNQNYITYVGAAEIKPVIYTVLEDENHTVVFYNKRSARVGRYEGTVVYAEHSHKVVSWDCVLIDE